MVIFYIRIENILTFFNLSLNLEIRSSWSEPQSAPSLVFANCIELLHLWLAFAPKRHLSLGPQGALSDLWGFHCLPRHTAQYRWCQSTLDWEPEGTGHRCWDPHLTGPGVPPYVSASLSIRNSIWFKDGLSGTAHLWVDSAPSLTGLESFRCSESLPDSEAGKPRTLGCYEGASR